LEVRGILEKKEKEEPAFFNRIISSLGPQELDSLKKCFAAAQEFQKIGN
jgi:hypothetical protein